MFFRQRSIFGSRFAAFCALTMAVLVAASCSSQERKAKKTIEDYLKNYGAREVKLQSFYTSRDFPDKAYASIIVTYNFADSTGKLQTVHIGYILRREGDGWIIDKSTIYTTDEKKANDYLAGRK